jgi:hypothetical protein
LEFDGLNLCLLIALIDRVGILALAPWMVQKNVGLKMDLGFGL